MSDSGWARTARSSIIRVAIMVGSTNLKQFLEAALRGAAKIVGCGSTNLILFNEKKQEIRVHLGITADAFPVIAEIEKMLGAQFPGFSWPMSSAEGSLVTRSWREASFCETTSLKELVGAALPPLILAATARLIGERDFACVPALSSTRNYGVLLFEKEGTLPFNRQQREVLLRYARRIGEILENDLMGQSQTLFDHLPDDEPDSLLFDARGGLRGHGPRGGAALERVLREGDLMRTIGTNARAFLEGPQSERERSLDLDGELRITLSRLDFDGTQGVLCMLSSPRQAAASLENQLVRLTLGDPAPALFVDPELRVSSCNPATKQLLGCEAENITGQPISALFSAPDEVMDILTHQTLDPQKAYSERATVVRRRDGSLVPVRVEALLLADDFHQLVGFLLVLREPSKRDSDHLVQQERLATMGEMAAHLAHEIRNPLVAIGATLESLIREPETAVSQRAILAALVKEIVRMDMTLKDYLAARREMAVTQVRVAELLDDARRLLAGAHRLAGKTIRCQVDPELTIEADYEAMKQVVFNLLLNALEATPAAGEVTCHVAQSGFELAITVEDRGPGLPASAADCLRPFFTTKKNGTGLGLAVCQKIARAHGGFVDLRNRDGGGCQATVVLPRRPCAIDGAA
ncbi:MAG: ATP-binding protein [Polyangia bacterium]|jgi:PAS domain S-box-containing protein